MARNSTSQVDVLICGGGPVGLPLSYQLARLGIKAYAIEQHDKSTQAMYGRACVFCPRTMEMLDQLDLGEALEQIGFIGRSTVTYHDGKSIRGRGWGFISKPLDTLFDYCLDIRQRYSENVFRDAAKALGTVMQSNTKSIGFIVDAGQGDYKITAELQDEGGKARRVQSKCIIGADGGYSTVRLLQTFLFKGTKWEKKR